METIVLGAGCFWGVEKLFKDLKGVLKTNVGYSGGSTENPTYKEVCTGTTGHIEVIQVQFDPKIISYQNILKYFFELHDPTQVDGQHNDIGTQYLSAIFTSNEKQKFEAEAFIQQIEEKNIFKKPIATKILTLEKYWPAEDYHQDYLSKNPGGYMCHYVRPINL